MEPDSEQLSTGEDGYRGSDVGPYDYVSAVSSDYPDETRLRLFIQHFPQEINPYARDILRFIQPRLTAERTLDAGCGAGWLSHALAEQTSLHAVDMSPVQIRKYRRLFEASGRRCSVSRQDVTALGLASNSFDGVVSIGATSVVDDLNDFFEEISRVLAPGGEFFVTVPDWSRLPPRGAADWELLFESHGFEVDAVEHCGCLLDKYAVRLGRLLDADVAAIERVLSLRDRHLSAGLDTLAQDRVYRLVRPV